MRLKKAHIPDFRHVTRAVQAHARPTALAIVQQFADKERGVFVERIKAQDFQAFHEIPLSANYLARKKRHGADLRTMIATKTYIDNIKVFHYTGDDGSDRIYIGFDPDAFALNLKGERTTTPLRLVAWVNERGSIKAHIPARPHWQPFLTEMNLRAPAVRALAARLICVRVNQDLKRRLLLKA